MKKLLFFLLLCSASVFAQRTINGVVVTNNDKPISFVTVQLVEKATDITVSYVQTNEKGEFSLAYQDTTKDYFLKLRMLGYHSLNFSVKNSNVSQKIVLKEKIEKLDEIVITRSYNKFKVNKDTVNFKLKNVLNNTEIQLKDIVEKLPGISINENKKISYQGKRIEKVTIEGNDFFGKKHEMAIENISADAVRGIKLLKNYKGFGDISSKKSNKIVLDISLKKDYKNRIVGNIDVKSGIFEKYQVHTNFFKFMNKGNVALVTELNNVGEPAINMMDYIEMSGGMSQFTKSNRNDGGSREIDHSKTPRFVFVNSKVDGLATFFNSLNITNTFSNKTQLTGYINIDRTKINELTKKTNTFIDTQPINVREKDQEEALSYLGNSYLTLTHKLNEDEVLSYNLKLNPFKEQHHIEIKQNFNLDALKNQRVFNIGQFLAYKKQVNDKLYITSGLTSDIKNLTQDITYQASQNILGNNTVLLNEETNNSHHFNIDVNSFYEFSDGLELNTVLNFEQQNDNIEVNSNHSLFDFKVKSVRNNFKLFNTLSYVLDEHFSTDIELNYYNNNLELNTINKQQNWLLPDVLVSCKLGNTTINFNYIKNYKNCTVAQSNPKKIVTEYNEIINPNSEIFTAIKNTVYGINLSSFSYSSKMFMLFFNYTNTLNAISFKTNTFTNYIEQSYIRVPSSSIGVNSRLSGSWNALKLGYILSGSFNRNALDSYVNTFKNNRVIQNYSTQLILNKDIKKIATVGLSLKCVRNQSFNDFKVLDYTFNQFYLKPKISGKYQDFFWNVNSNLIWLMSENKQQKIQDFNFSLQWRFTKTLELFFKGNNIFNLERNSIISIQEKQGYRQFMEQEQLEGNVLVGMRFHI